MLSDFVELQKIFSNSHTKVLNTRLNQVISGYSFLQFSNELDIDQLSAINQNINDSNVIIINQDEKTNQIAEDQYFIVGFEKTIIIIKQDLISFLNPILLNRNNLNICFLSNTKQFFDKYVNAPYKEINSIASFEDLLFNFKQHLSTKENKSINKIWMIVKSCISAYLIHKSFLKLNRNRIDTFSINQEKNDQKVFLSKDDYIRLIRVGAGSLFFI